MAILTIIKTTYWIQTAENIEKIGEAEKDRSKEGKMKPQYDKFK